MESGPLAQDSGDTQQGSRPRSLRVKGQPKSGFRGRRQAELVSKAIGARKLGQGGTKGSEWDKALSLRTWGSQSAGRCHRSDLPPDTEVTAPAQFSSGRVGLLRTLGQGIPILPLLYPKSPFWLTGQFNSF